MKENINFDFYYGKQAEQFNFYRIPKLLFTDKRFSDVSIEAKVLYGLMLDRMSLSLKNGWVDEENRVYIYFKLEDAMDFMGIGKDKGVKLFAELDYEKGCGLICREKQGFGKPAMIYVMNFNTEIADEKNEENEPVQHTSEKPNSAEVGKTEVLTSENQKSGLLENRTMDFGKTEANNTKNNNTEISNIYPIYGEGANGNTPRETYYMFNDDSERFFKYYHSYSSTHKAYMYDVKICKKQNGVMNVVSESSFSTGASTIPAYTPTTINGIDENAYMSIGMSPPLFKIGNGFILKNGKAVGFLPENIGTSYNWCIYNGRIAIVRNIVDGNYLYYKDENGLWKYWQRINYLNFTDSEVTLSEDIDLPVGAYTNLSGYYSSYSNFVNYDMFVGIGEATLTQWWSHYLDNKFSDGRYVSAHWVGMGNSMYEIWYDVYDKDGTLISTGPSGFSTTASSSLTISELRAFAINDTKIILALATVANSWFNEYYRASVVTENDDGIVEVLQPLGKKNLVVPEDTDTEPVNEVIDFTAEDLEIGFNIKENIIGTDKLTSELREQVNSIYLNDITVVAKEETVRGRWKIGFSLPSFQKYDYSFGEEPIYFYTNGRTLNWSCANPENLTPGTYEQMLYIDGKSFYVTVKVIEPPSNDSTSIVVF